MDVRTRGRGLRRTRVARAFAPGHLTGLFAPDTASRDPRARGSIGAGIVLDRGVWADAMYRPEEGRRLRFRSTAGRSLPISREVARRLQGSLPGTLEIRLRHELPIGQGFGTSAAGALATGLAAARVLGVDPARAIQVAHLCDLFGHGGLGGVSAILGGGWERRLLPGVPPYGRAVHHPFRPPIWVAVLGSPMDSRALLQDRRFLDRVARSAHDGLRRLEREPRATVLLDESERFSDRLQLAPEPESQLIRRLRADGAWASQAMFGRTVWAVARTAGARERVVRTLEAAGVAASELSAAGRGAWVITGPRGRAQAF